MGKNKRKLNRTSCPICLDNCKHTDMVKKFKCNHYFCSECLGKHFGSKSSAVCPLCRKPVDVNFLNEKETELYNNRPSYLEDNDINPFELLSNLVNNGSNDINSNGLVWYGGSAEEVSRLSRAFGFTREVNINDLHEGISKILPGI